MCSPFFFCPILPDLGLFPANSSFSPHQDCNNRRSVFQWKPLINNNLHLKCNLILTTCALYVNWIFLFEGQGREDGWCCRCSGSALAWEAKLIYIKKNTIKDKNYQIKFARELPLMYRMSLYVNPVDIFPSVMQRYREYHRVKQRHRSDVSDCR